MKKSLTIALFLLTVWLTAQTKQYQAATIAFYNTENLFDPYYSVDVVDKRIPFANENYKVSMPKVEAEKVLAAYTATHDSLGEVYINKQILSDEFTPEGKKNFDSLKYQRKLENLSRVISEIGFTKTQNAPVIVGLAEVENRQVVEDLINQPSLKKYNYKIVHYNSFDARGIDVALIYQAGRFTVTNSKRYIVELPNNEEGYPEKTRDVLRVTGLLDGEPFSFIVNHWPSRRGGEIASQPKREAAAAVLKSIFEERMKVNPEEKIIAMGDFNDDPVSPSVKKVLEAKENKNRIKDTDIYSPMESMYRKGFGTLAYQDSWNLFDMIFMNKNLITTNKEYSAYKELSTNIYSPLYLIADEGQYKGYPRRMYGGDTFDKDGYSDHFPVYTVLIKEVQQ